MMEVVINEREMDLFMTGILDDYTILVVQLFGDAYQLTRDN